jgi:DHA2 family methylenomycin A resistance protein-like MFS transporter
MTAFPDTAPAARATRQQVMTLAATSLGFSLIILDVTVVNVALERVQADLAMTLSGLQWVANAYTLVFASLLLTGGALGDRLGAKQVFIGGSALFTLASLTCGLAPDAATLVASRLVQGIGAALCLPTALALLNIAFPDAVGRARAVGIWAGMGGLALAAGPVVGGVLVEMIGWRAIFLINLPLGALAIWAAAREAPSAPRHTGRGIDLPGQLLGILALGGLTIALIEGHELGWQHPLVLGGFVLALVAGGFFILVEARSANPMLPLSLFANRTVAAGSLVGLLNNFGYYGLLFILSLFFQSAKGYSPLMTGLAFLPMTASVTLVNLAAGRLTARFGARPPMVIGQAIAAVAYLSMAGIDAGTPYWIMAIPLLIAASGTALSVPAMTAAVLGAADRKRSGIAAGAFNAARQIGGMIGVSVVGALAAAGGAELGANISLAFILAGSASLAASLLSLIGIREPSRALSATELAEESAV